MTPSLGADFLAGDFDEAEWVLPGAFAADAGF
jgi:hypothetical protein